MNNFQLFKEIYIKNSYFGHRVSKKSLLYHIKNEEVVDTALNNLYIECPTKFSGENPNEKHYLLKYKWQILDQFWITIQICKQKPSRTFEYIKYFISFLFDLKSNRKFYMHPTQISRFYVDK